MLYPPLLIDVEKLPLPSVVPKTVVVIALAPGGRKESWMALFTAPVISTRTASPEVLVSAIVVAATAPTDGATVAKQTATIKK